NAGRQIREMFLGETQFYVYHQHQGHRRILAVVRFYKNVVDVDGLRSTAGLVKSVDSNNRFHVVWPYGKMHQTVKFGNPSSLG
ncbi:hypothetical protein EC973_006734, partial [Apophysomyces ossiformis]